MARSKQKIEKFFEEVVFNWMCKGVEGCIESDINNLGVNYVVALTLLSYTEFLGGLIDGSLGETRGGHDRFNNALKFFDFAGNENYYKDFEISFKDVDGRDKKGGIYTLFRCGVAHEYFIKGDSVVSRSVCGCDTKGISIANINGKKILQFQCRAYFRDFKKAWEKYYNKLVKESDRALLNNFNQALDRIEARELKL